MPVALLEADQPQKEAQRPEVLLWVEQPPQESPKLLLEEEQPQRGVSEVLLENRLQSEALLEVERPQQDDQPVDVEVMEVVLEADQSQPEATKQWPEVLLEEAKPQQGAPRPEEML